MNQTNPHFTQWKNLPDEQKAEHDFDNYKYEFQHSSGYWLNIHVPPLDHNLVIRLVIEPGKWYFLEESDGFTSYVIKGSEISPINTWPILRPARPDEIPERKFNKGEFYPFILNGTPCIGEYCPDMHRLGGLRVTDPAVSWIGEELKVNWGCE